MVSQNIFTEDEKPLQQWTVKGFDNDDEVFQKTKETCVRRIPVS